jgi:hypothetical protein
MRESNIGTGITIGLLLAVILVLVYVLTRASGVSAIPVMQPVAVASAGISQPQEGLYNIQPVQPETSAPVVNDGATRNAYAYQTRDAMLTAISQANATDTPVNLNIDAITCKQTPMFVIDVNNQWQNIGFIPHATRIKLAHVYDGVLKLAESTQDFKIPSGTDIYIFQSDICVEGQTY